MAPGLRLLSGSAGSGVPNGGTAGQVLAKNSSTNGDAGWKNVAGGKLYVNTGSTPGDLVSGEAFFGDDGSGNLARVGAYDENTGTVKELLVPVGSSGVGLTRLTNSGAQTLWSAGAGTSIDKINFDTELQDDLAFASASTGNITIPSNGIYVVRVGFQYSNSTGTKTSYLYLNDTTANGASATTGGKRLDIFATLSGQTNVSLGTQRRFVTGDILHVLASTTAAVNTALVDESSPIFSIAKIAN